jgi:hypothetical protein
MGAARACQALVCSMPVTSALKSLASMNAKPSTGRELRHVCLLGTVPIDPGNRKPNKQSNDDDSCATTVNQWGILNVD